MTTHYEMLWDCSSCGTTGLLGKSMRRCPQCGAPQDPDKRYFPKEGAEVVAAGHVFVGADWSCAACATPNSKAAGFCVNCGNPREGNRSVTLAGGAPVKASAPKLTRTINRRKLGVAAAVAGLVAVALTVTMCWTKDTVVTVDQHRWTRDIDIERFEPHHDSSWCDSMPSGAYSVSRHREQRSTRQVADGQECHDKNVDNGDGTFHKQRVCSTRYRSEPVYDDKCSYTIDRWGVSRTAHAAGVGLAPGPSWPATSLARTGTCLGCEREGSRRQKLTLDLHDAKKRYDCDVDDDRWRRLTDGRSTKMKVRVLTGGAVCSSLRP